MREICEVVDVIGRIQVQRILNQMLADGLVTYEIRPAGETNQHTRFFKPTGKLVNPHEVSCKK